MSNLSGHKFPTGYPSRRAWLHVRVTDAAGAVLFESGGLRPDGSIIGNDNDVDGTRFEPHHATIEREDQVQIYEDIMVDSDGLPTTGLLRGVRYIKDNRLLPAGMVKAQASGDIAVHGEAQGDADFRWWWRPRAVPGQRAQCAGRDQGRGGAAVPVDRLSLGAESACL